MFYFHESIYKSKMYFDVTKFWLKYSLVSNMIIELFRLRMMNLLKQNELRYSWIQKQITTMNPISKWYKTTKLFYLVQWWFFATTCHISWMHSLTILSSDFLLQKQTLDWKFWQIYHTLSIKKCYVYIIITMWIHSDNVLIERIQIIELNSFYIYTQSINYGSLCEKNL